MKGINNQNLRLYFSKFYVGQIDRAFWSDETGYGLFHFAEPPVDEPILRRIREYLEFSEQWHQRLKQGLSPDSKQWDVYTDLLTSTDWAFVMPDGSAWKMGSPVFVEGEITWRPLVWGIAERAEGM